MNIFKKFFQWLRRGGMYVIADAKDNSVTISKDLFDHMGIMQMDEAKVFVFRVGDNYAFMLNPTLEQPTHLADMQYNSKYRCIGFECLVPTVNRIFYDYGLPANSRAKLTVQAQNTHGMEYYVIRRPHEKYTRQHTEK